jgi:RimJ/RimL family protein N-acetyltransferase
VKHIILGYEDLVAPWVLARAGGDYYPGSCRAISLFDGDRIIAGVLYDNYNGANIHGSMAAVEGSRWLNREFLRVVFEYPFLQLGVKRITGLVAESNHLARRLDEHLGFKLEATLQDAHPSGNLLVYAMHKAECHWINNTRLYRGQI